MLYYYESISYVGEVTKCSQQLFVILLVKSYAGFVQYIENTHKA